MTAPKNDSFMRQRGKEGTAYHHCSSSLFKSRSGARGIFTEALKVRVLHKDEVDLKSNYEVRLSIKLVRGCVNE